MKWLRFFVLLLATVSGCRGGTPRATAPEPSPNAKVRFEDVAAEMGVEFVSGIADQSPLNITRMVSGGAGFLDYDNDEWPDLVLAGVRGVRLYRNQRGESFEDITPGSGLERIVGEPQGVAAADYDGDGRTDLLVTLYDGARLYRNVGNGRFRDTTVAAGLQIRGWATSAAFADVNGDGWLDLYVGRYVHFEPGMPEYQRDGDAMLSLGPDAYEPRKGLLFLNEAGRFREATREAGLDTPHGKTLGVTFADYDQDGDQDLYLANDQALGDFFENNGRGRFRNISVDNGTATSSTGKHQAGMGADWGDFNLDGRLDLLVATFYNEPKSLYRQDEGGVFTEVGQTAGLLTSQLRGTAFGVAFADWDNDGWQDLMLANGHVQDQLDRIDPATGYRQRTQVLQNEAGAFREVSEAAGAAFSQKIVGRGLAVADFNRDGRQDAVVANFVGPPLLLRNESQAGNWVALRLNGKAPNPRGLGAVVTLSDGGSRQTRLIQTGRSYLAAFPAEVHFGLGKHTVATAEIRWPDGTVQQVRDLKLNSVNAVTHP